MSADERVAAKGPSPWVPRATCDASCVAAGGAPGGSPVVVAARVAVRATLAVILLSAVPLLAIPMPGRSHVQRGYCRMMLRALGVRITVSGGPDSQPARRARRQRPCVLGRHLLDRRRDARLVRRQGRADQLARPRYRRPLDEGHPDRTGQPAAAARRRRHGRRPAARRPDRGGVPRGHHLVRPGLRAVPARDVPGRRRRGQAGAAAAAELSPPRRHAVHRRRLRRRRHPAGVDPPPGHRPPHRRATCRSSRCSCREPTAATWPPAAKRRCAATRGRRAHGHALVA